MKIEPDLEREREFAQLRADCESLSQADVDEVNRQRYLLLAEDPGNASARFFEACVMRIRGDMPACYQNLAIALATDPTHYGARMILAQCLRAEGKSDVAAAVIESACRIVKRHAPRRQQARLLSILTR